MLPVDYERETEEEMHPYRKLDEIQHYAGIFWENKHCQRTHLAFHPMGT